MTTIQIPAVLPDGTVLAGARLTIELVTGSRRPGHTTGAEIVGKLTRHIPAVGVLSITTLPPTSTIEPEGTHYLGKIDDGRLAEWHFFVPDSGTYQIGDPEISAVGFAPAEMVPGPAGQVTGASATTLPPGSLATVTPGGTPQARTFTFGIPRGDKGATGANIGDAELDVDPGVSSFARVRDLGVNVMLFGAVGDGATVDTVAIQAAIDAAASAGAQVVFPPKTFLTGGLTVPAGVTLHGPGATLKAHTGTTALLNVTGNNVAVRGLRLTGLGYASITPGINGRNGIRCIGASSSSYIDGLIVEDVHIDQFAGSGIWAQFVSNFTFTPRLIERCTYSGIHVLSGRDGKITGELRHFGNPDTGVPATNAYGLSLTRQASNPADSLAAQIAAHPRTERVTVSAKVHDNPLWEGLDTHGGKDISFVGCVVTDCKHGIAVVPSDDSNGVEHWAPKNISIVGGSIRGLGTGYGLNLSGASDGLDLATISVSGMTVTNSGEAGNNNAGAIRALYTQGLTIAGATVIGAQENGIVLFQNNFGFSISGVTVVDPVGSSGTVCAVRSHNVNNTGHIGGVNLSLSSGATPPTFGLRVDNDTGVSISVGVNDFSAAASAVSDSGSKLKSVISAPLDAPTRTLLGPFTYDNITGSVAATAMAIGGRTAAVMPRTGSVTGVVVRSSEARTVGNLTVEVTVNGSGVGLTATLNSSNTTFLQAVQAIGSDTFTAGAQIGVNVASTSWSPGTADLTVYVEVVS